MKFRFDEMVNGAAGFESANYEKEKRKKRKERKENYSHFFMLVINYTGSPFTLKERPLSPRPVKCTLNSTSSAVRCFKRHV